MTTIAGIYGTTGAKDGIYGVSVLSNATAITLDAIANVLYVSDAGTHLIRRITLYAQYITTTIVGNTDITKDLLNPTLTLTKLIPNYLVVYTAGGGLSLKYAFAGNVYGFASFTYMSNAAGSIIEMSLSFPVGYYWSIKIWANASGSSYLEVLDTGIYYVNNITNPTIPYTNNFDLRAGDTLRIIKLPNNVFFQAIRNGGVYQIAGYDSSQPFYNAEGYAPNIVATLKYQTDRNALSKIIEYPIPLWDAFVANASPNNGAVTAAGTTPVTVTNTQVTANSNIILNRNGTSVVTSAPAFVSSITPGVSFTIVNTVADTSTYNYIIMN